MNDQTSSPPPEYAVLQSRRVVVYRFQDAPDELRALSQNGGDEDWLALIPPSLCNIHIPWLEEGTPFGYCCVDSYPHPSPFFRGWRVVIGSHA